MKAIQQLIGYFEERGQLTPKQVQELIKKGYWARYTSADIRNLERQIGQSFMIQATGETRGALWGTDVYTSDSNLGMACVHAGLLQPGEKGIVKVTMVTPLATFPGTARNGVTSQTWSTGWSGAYTVEAVRS